MKNIRQLLTTDRNADPGAFSSLRPEVIAEAMNLTERGRQSGAAELPETRSASPDATEQEIESHMRMVATESHKRLIDQLYAYEERLKSVDASGSSATMKAHARQSESNFQSALVRIQGELRGARDLIDERAAAFSDFREANGLKRPPHPKRNHLWMSVVLALFFVGESFPNAVLISGGSEGGIIGGYTIAFLFSALNLAVAFLGGFTGWTNITHRSYFRKAVGTVIVLFTLGFICVLNLGLAHFRFAIEDGRTTEEAANFVVQTFMAQPFAVGNIISMLLVGWGFLGAGTAMTEGWMWQDPYPGYGSIARYLRDAQEAFQESVEAGLDDLKEVETKFVEMVKSERAALRDRRKQVPRILEERKRIVKHYHVHIQSLQDTGRMLLASYRDANRAVRKTSAPRRFDELWMLEGFDTPELDDASWVFPEAEFHAADESLTASIDRLQTSYEEGISWIRTLAAEDKAVDIKRGLVNVSAA